ncbi:Methylenetetrahydrofolate reductase isozyme [Komagataella phaffii CBS 7435]|uniref:Methylenetetrahydrofolate reductase isozyme n=1 Tax=Komagataella phaffii (strain ATCC 76273 / CBS 7435 / CECT 11047 / NRRL Y-11430 / Wegner 21-1) TaxID=981350 RepID=F2QR20_KOMPC|nr:GQ67_01200T0 [Komagataella phaffii]AOA68137.1 GQ68_00189T0 [Komagataella phaffii GS115]CAH2447664.1 Methylenetetrahydrofolate reductase isozyme [Komagataella phaffii CBS 7435]CCA37848.1 Methylenetetrahydrofolate reductase isozyme [Komagataella phaffii CBS 7435]
MKITEKLSSAHRREDAPPTFSFEFFTPKTAQGVQNLYDRMDRMYNLSPQFIDITWNAGGRSSNLTCEMINTAQTVLGLETCMHLTCTNMTLEVIDEALKSAYDSGCQNILALRGDPPLDGSESTGCFRYAKDLIKHIKEKYGDHFCIGVAAYPEGHPDEPDVDRLIEILKEKQDAGGDFMITQMFYDVEQFITWCKKVRDYGITIPIIPGIMPISTYASFSRRAKWCQINVPSWFQKQLDASKDDDSEVRCLGTQLVADMCLKLVESGYVNHLHFYTMNLEKSTIMVLEKLQLIDTHNQPVASVRDCGVESQVTVPWRRSLNPTRVNESIRPIFWSNRKFTYISRTSNWDEFPNGRWGDSRSPAFGEVDLCDGDLIRHSPKRAVELWGKPQSIDDVIDLFVRYLQGNLSSLPWSDGETSKEINVLLDDLLALNRQGILTINSQPCVNGLPSNHNVHGWGPSNGFVYQKQYLEFFIPAKFLTKLISNIEELNKSYSSNFNTLTFYAVNAQGELITNSKEDDINAVTWGIFPGKEVVQPTIVERCSFLAWKDEAFRVFKAWSSLFKDQDQDEFEVLRDSKTRAVLDKLHDEYFLVNIVDNNYVQNPNVKIFDLFKTLH